MPYKAGLLNHIRDLIYYITYLVRAWELRRTESVFLLQALGDYELPIVVGSSPRQHMVKPTFLGYVMTARFAPVGALPAGVPRDEFLMPNVANNRLDADGEAGCGKSG